METYRDILEHHGIKGMHWGIRRYRNEDGSLTNAGKERYADSSDKNITKKQKSSSQLSTEKKVAIGAAVAASVYLGTTLTAKHLVVKEGKKKYDNLMKQAMSVPLGGFTPLQRHMNYSRRNQLMQEATKALEDSKQTAKKMELIRSIRYLNGYRKSRK